MVPPSTAPWTNAQDHPLGIPHIALRPGSLFSATTSYFEPQEPSFAAASAQGASMEDLERAGWDMAAFDFGKPSPRRSTNTAGRTGSSQLSKSFSTRIPSTYLPHKQRSDIDLRTVNSRTSSPAGPRSRSSITAPVGTHERAVPDTYIPSALNFATLAEQNQYDRASIASHATGTSVATSRRGAIGARNALRDEEEYIVARVQAVVLFSAEAIGEKNKKMGPSFEESVKARRWGMGLMKEAREKYSAGIAEAKSSDGGAGPEGGWRKSFD